MKKILFLLLLILLFSIPVYSQLAVTAPILETLFYESGLERVIHYAQMVADNVTQIELLIEQGQNMARTVQMTANNWRALGDVRSWNDFTDWYNRQLYMEQMTEQAFMGMSITIGNRSYPLMDIEGIARGIDETYIRYWENEFTPEQRQAMWVGLGLTPSNYAYVQTWRDRNHQVARRLFANAEIQNQNSMEQAIRDNEITTRVAQDQFLDEDDRLGERELLAYVLETMLSSTRQLREISGQIADIMQLQAVQYYLLQTPSDAPVISNWPDPSTGGFAPLGSSAP
jgi:hypothetical protein